MRRGHGGHPRSFDGSDPIGIPAEPTSVFILAVEKGQAPVSDPFVIEDHMHLAWGMCTRIGD